MRFQAVVKRLFRCFNIKFAWFLLNDALGVGEHFSIIDGYFRSRGGRMGGLCTATLLPPGPNRQAARSSSDCLTFLATVW